MTWRLQVGTNGTAFGMRVINNAYNKQKGVNQKMLKHLSNCECEICKARKRRERREAIESTKKTKQQLIPPPAFYRKIITKRGD
jgi:hypothetical protein